MFAVGWFAWPVLWKLPKNVAPVTVNPVAKNFTSWNLLPKFDPRLVIFTAVPVVAVPPENAPIVQWSRSARDTRVEMAILQPFILTF